MPSALTADGRSYRYSNSVAIDPYATPMAPDRWQEIAALIDRGDAQGVVDALVALDEPERTRLSTAAREAARARSDVLSWRDETVRRQANAANAVVFGTGGPAAAAGDSWFDVLEEKQGLRDQLIRARPRAWRQDWAERVLEMDNARWDWP